MSHSKKLSIKSFPNKAHEFLTILPILRPQVVSIRFLIHSLLFAGMYLILTNLITMFAVYSNIISQQYDSLLKLKVMGLMLVSSTFTGPTLYNILVLFITLFVGVNIALVLRKIRFVKAQRNLQWTFGAGLLTLASTGCPACGLSILSVTGITTAVIIPVNSMHTSILIIFVLLATTVYNLYSLGKTSCRIK